MYDAGLAFLEQNLHTLERQGCFDHESVADVMMRTREKLEWHFKQLDHAVGLSFRSNFHFALVGHLLKVLLFFVLCDLILCDTILYIFFFFFCLFKGFRHPTPSTVFRTSRILGTLLSLVAKPFHRDKFEVTSDNVAYLTALVAVSEEVRSRCHVKHAIPRWTTDLSIMENGETIFYGNQNVNDAHLSNF